MGYIIALMISFCMLAYAAYGLIITSQKNRKIHPKQNSIKNNYIPSYNYHQQAFQQNTYSQQSISRQKNNYPELQYNSMSLLVKKLRAGANRFVVIDFETTGFSPYSDKIIEIGAVKVTDGIIHDSFNTLINPRMRIPPQATRVNNITDRMVANAPYIEHVLSDFIKFLEDRIIVAHNAPFDIKFLLTAAYDSGLTIDNSVVDTLTLCRRVLPDLPNHKLGTVANCFRIDLCNAHRSLSDVMATAQILINCINILNYNDEQKALERKHQKELKKASAE